MKGPRDHALGLLEKASHDLIAAEATIATGQALDTVCFHAQQAAEKCIKALLALEDVVYPHRHDMAELVNLTTSRFPELLPLVGELIGFSAYAVQMRYDEAMAPDMDEARSALEMAREVHAIARRIIESREPEGES
ncbi:MAG: HEPN domain-containing protein [Candidatus Brocadiia bacterium]|nr:HEPN domain-containing protein [Candidatus Brocadiia bacterium]